MASPIPLVLDRSGGAPGGRGSAGRVWWAVGLVAALWAALVSELELDWSTNPQYRYGYLVPVLALYLIWTRWDSRPAVSACAAGAPAKGVALVAALLGLALIPTRLIQEATPEWSAVRWVLALEVLGITGAVVVRMAGWAMARHLAWALGFILIAVAWPSRFENGLTQGLMQALAQITAEMLSWAGVAAVPEGNLIRLGQGLVGVDEACSGVRSLQSMLMAAWFLGETHRLKGWGRLGLAATALTIAVFFNLTRTLLLLSIAASHGLAALTRWHDPAGYSIFVVSFLVLLGVVRFFPRESVAAPAAGAGTARAWQPLPWAWLLGIGLCAVVAEGGTELWYRAHEVRMTGRPERWEVRWPTSEPAFADREISPTVQATLAYNEGREAGWTGADGSAWLMFAFRWKPGRTSTISARLHRPEICLPGGGRILRDEQEIAPVSVGTMSLPFESYEFDDRGQPLHVFFCLWEAANRDRAAQPRGTQLYGFDDRMRRVWSGQRNLGQQSLEVIVSGYATAAEAEVEFRRLMGRVLVPAS